MNENKIKKRKYEAISMNKNLKTVDDLIEIIDTYDTHFLEFKLLKQLYDELKGLSGIIGMENIKKDVVKLILYELQELENKEDIGHHICITGDPGVGKTEVSKIIAKILLKIKGWNSDKFFVATKNDLVGRFVGQTPGKVQAFIDKCKFGCMFIDEVYSLSSNDDHDGFDKELIDTLVHNLSENKSFICIIAGYKKDTDKRFFEKNPGLRRRFAYTFNIGKYTETELFMILKRKVELIQWCFDGDKDLDNKTIKLIKDNMEYFEYSGGDVVQLLKKIKIISSQRTFCLPFKLKRIITFDDIKEGLKVHIQHYKEIKKENISHKMMYL
jgi:Cdc6-like AAA superfamily ATPase